MRANYETAYERETDMVCRIVNDNRREPEYEAVLVKVGERAEQQRVRCRKAAQRILATVSTVCATLTAVAACNGNWQSAFAGAGLLLILAAGARITE